MRIWIILAAAHAALLAAPLAAQDAPADSTPPEPGVLRKGAWSLSFTAPGYSAGEGGEFGVWQMVGTRTRLGVTLDVLVRGSERDDSAAGQTDAATRLGLGLNLRRFLATEARVAPYLQARVFGRGAYGRLEQGPYSTESRGVFAGVEAAVGAEWFPVRAFSISGHTGVRVQAQRREDESTAPDREPLESTYRDLAFQTFTSTLAVQIHF